MWSRSWLSLSWWWQIGTCLGEGSTEFQNTLRAEFCELFDFSDRPFLECIRVFFQAFRLPGESQQIDRMCVSALAYPRTHAHTRHVWRRHLFHSRVAVNDVVPIAS